MMMIIIATNVIDNDLVIMIVLITIIIWPFQTWIGPITSKTISHSKPQMKCEYFPSQEVQVATRRTWTSVTRRSRDEISVKIALGFVFFAKAPGKVAFSPQAERRVFQLLSWGCELLNFGGCRSFRRLCTHLLNFLFDDACVCVCVMSNVLWSLYWDRI